MRQLPPHLRAELLGGELEGGDDLLGQNLGVLEPEAEEHDLGNHGVVRDHHGHRSEESLQ